MFKIKLASSVFCLFFSDMFICIQITHTHRRPREIAKQYYPHILHLVKSKSKMKEMAINISHAATYHTICIHELFIRNVGSVFDGSEY